MSWLKGIGIIIGLVLLFMNFNTAQKIFTDWTNPSNETTTPEDIATGAIDTSKQNIVIPLWLLILIIFLILIVGR